MNLKSLFCKHKHSDVVCWHWTHGVNGNEPLFLEIQLKCNKCGKYFFRYIKDKQKCCDFAEKYIDKQWSDKCKPVL